MSMDWKFLKRTLPHTILIALSFSAAIAILTPIPFLVAAPILLFSWPVTDIIIEAIDSDNPNGPQRLTEPQARKTLFVQFAVMGVLAVGVSFGMHLPYLTAFSGILLVLSPLGSINSILAKRENNAPGGFNNPDSDHKE